MITQTNSNIGLRGKKPKNPFFPLHSRPKPKEKGRVDFGVATSLLFVGFPCTQLMFPSKHHFKITSILSSLSLSATSQTHTHFTNSLKEHSRKLSPFLLIISRFLEAFKMIFQANHHLR